MPPEAAQPNSTDTHQPEETAQKSNLNPAGQGARLAKQAMRTVARLAKGHWVIAILLVVVLAMGTGSVLLSRPTSTRSTTSPSSATTTTTDTKTPEQSAVDATALVVAKASCTSPDAVQLTANWTGKRSKLADLGVFSYDDEKDYGKADVAYYQVGSTSDGKAVIMATTPAQGPGGDDTAILVEDTPGHYLVLARHSNMKPYDQDGTVFVTYKLASNAAYDTKKEFADLCVPDTLTYKNATLEARAWFYDLAPPAQTDSSPQPVALEQHNYGTLTEYTYTATDQYKMVYFGIPMHDTRFMRYDYPNPLPSAGTSDNGASKPPKIVWSDGSSNTDFYSTKFLGCGSGGTYEIALSLGASDLVQIGTGPDGKPLYGFANTSNSLFQIHYQDYLSEYKVDGQGNTPNVSNFDKALVGLSAADWQKHHPLVILPDGMGRYIVMLSDQFSVGGGCGKPVVYLYPTKPTMVSVKVGAHVTVSDPTYGDGWRVFADPSGKLLWNGLPYGSLFWEGTGLGMYPVVNTGTVVQQGQLASTVERQLGELGLNSQERSDFLAFWLPRLPKTPYVRLTWFDTEQMNQLAPLAVSPQPTTMIRVFLDYQGLEQPVSIAPQTLHSSPRVGFTLVEWGGILH